jgi:hypothetical protein
MLGEGDGPGDGVTVTVREGKSDGAGTLVGMLKWWWEELTSIERCAGPSPPVRGLQGENEAFLFHQVDFLCAARPFLVIRNCRSYSGARVWLRVATFGQLRERSVIELASAKPLGWSGLTDEVR